MRWFFLCILLLGLFRCSPKRDRGALSFAPDAQQPTRTTLRVLSKKRLAEDDSLRLVVQIDGKKWQEVADSVSVRISEPLSRVFTQGDTIAFAVPRGLPLGQQAVQLVVHMKDETQEEHLLHYMLLAKEPPQHYGYAVEAVHLHDPDSYTQGLFYHNGHLYESTGQKGTSFVQKVDVTSGRILQKTPLDKKIFGEGIVRYKDKIYQLTWKSKKGFIYRLEDLSLLDSFRYETEGWGLALWKDQLVMSDGTEYLRFFDPETMEKVREVQVYDHQGEVRDLNELESAHGLLYANIFQKKIVKVVVPETGRVAATIDFEHLHDFSYYERRIDVMNGIAYREDTDRFYLTGKWWPKLFEVRLEARLRKP